MAVTITLDLQLLDRVYTGFVVSILVAFCVHWAIKYAKILLNVKDGKKTGAAAAAPWRVGKVFMV